MKTSVFDVRYCYLNFFLFSIILMLLIMQPRIDFSNKADSILDCYPLNAPKPLMVCDFFFFYVQTAQAWREQMVLKKRRGLSGFQDKVTYRCNFSMATSAVLGELYLKFLFNKPDTGDSSGLLIAAPVCTLTIHYPNLCARFIKSEWNYSWLEMNVCN